MREWLAILAVAVITIVILALTELRKKRIAPYCDAFALAFCEAAEHVLPRHLAAQSLAYAVNEAGKINVLPLDEQPDALRAVFSQQVDEYAMQRFRVMHDQRINAQKLLTGFNLIDKKYNACLNHCYDLMNLFLSALEDFSVIVEKKDIEDIESFLYKQRHLRTVTLASIITPACREKLDLLQGAAD
ncbi:MAG: hypothetical protein RR527_01690 [Clostridia bacterium]